ncbi:MAG: hypothetical protein WC551_08930 [Patescibacteria group bacterium]
MKVKEFNSEMALLLDRSSDVRAVCDRVMDSWRYNLADRKLGPAYQDESGNFITGLDLAAYLASIVGQRGKLTFPTYKARRAKTIREGETVISATDRGGRAIGLVSNADVFSFGISFEDQMVASIKVADGSPTVETGKARTFMVQDIYGTPHEGLDEIVVEPETPEQKILFQETDRVAFQYLIHPNRWTSFYGRPYILAKVAILRLQDQVRHLKAERTRVQGALGISKAEWPKSATVGESKSVKVPAFNAFVDGANFHGEFPTVETSQEGLGECGDLLHRCNELLTELRFHVRATEFAFYSQVLVPGVKDLAQWLKGGVDTLEKPSWCGASWATGYREPKGRTDFAVLCRPGLPTLRFRVWEKSEKVAVET